MDVQPRGVGVDILQEVGMGEHHPLGIPRGSRGIYDGQEIRWIDLRRKPGQQLRILGVEFPADFENFPVEVNPPFQDFGNRRGIAVFDNEDLPAGIPILLPEDLTQGVQLLEVFQDHEPGIGVIKDELHLRGGRIGTAGYRYRPQGDEGKVGGDPLEAVVYEESDVILPGDPEVGQTGGEGSDGVQHVAVGFFHNPFGAFNFMGNTVGIRRRRLKGNLQYVGKHRLSLMVRVAVTFERSNI